MVVFAPLACRLYLMLFVFWLPICEFKALGLDDHIISFFKFCITKIIVRLFGIADLVYKFPFFFIKLPCSFIMFTLYQKINNAIGFSGIRVRLSLLTSCWMIYITKPNRSNQNGEHNIANFTMRPYKRDSISQRIAKIWSTSQMTQHKKVIIENYVLMERS